MPELNLGRRAFLAMLAGAALDPERLLWRPGAKLISIPRPPLVVEFAVGDIVSIGGWPERWRVTRVYWPRQRVIADLEILPPVTNGRGQPGQPGQPPHGKTPRSSRDWWRSGGAAAAGRKP